MKSELEKLGETLLSPCQRPGQIWKFDGQTYNTEVTTLDLVDARTWRSYRVIENLQCYEPKKFKDFLVHNKDVAALLANAVEAWGLQKLYETATENELFQPKIDLENGLVVTSTATENKAMNVNRWITDSIHNLALVENEGQQGHIIRLLAKFYCTPTEQVAFKRIIENPWLYRNPNEAREGVAHIFQVNKIEGELYLQRDPNWHNNKRLESHGLALRTFCDFLAGKLAKNARNKVEKEICKAIASLALYFQAIDYPTAPSAGAWEEIPLPDGLSWDTEAIRQGLCALQKLMFTANPNNLGDYRKNIRKSARQLANLSGRIGADALFKKQEILEELIEIGAKQSRLRVCQRAEAPGMRHRDASLTFLAQSDLDLLETDDEYERIVGTVKLYKRLLDDLGDLVRESGMIRYEPFSREPDEAKEFFDSYLTVNYWLVFDEDGYFNPARMRLTKEFESSDASDLEVLKRRTKLGIPNREAEWFLVTEMARGYAKQAQRLFPILKKKEISQEQQEETQALFDSCREKACEYVMRGYARITPDSETGNIIKSNGEPCNPWQLPEAYEWVRVCAKAVDKTKTGFVEKLLPGVNTSLAWAASSLKIATEETLRLFA